MPTVERILLIVNRAAGTGYSRDTAERLRDLLTDAVGERATLRVEIVDDHPTARICASRFLAASNTPALIIAGGGGGTLRAVIEGICEGSAVGHLPGPERVRLGALRMGSGNVLAQQFGVPPNAEAGLRGIITNLHANRTVPCCVVRLERLRAMPRFTTRRRSEALGSSVAFPETYPVGTADGRICIERQQDSSVLKI